MIQEKYMNTSNECAAKEGVTFEEIAKLSFDELAVSPHKCFIKCFVENSDFIVVLEFLSSFPKNEKVKCDDANFAKCGQLYKADAFDCDAALETFRCLDQI